MTFDFLIGFATPGSRVVKQSKQGLKGWFLFAIWRNIEASDGNLRIVAVRLLGITVGVNITTEISLEAAKKRFEANVAKMKAAAPQQVAAK
jgi:hypothetical protein